MRYRGLLILTLQSILVTFGVVAALLPVFLESYTLSVPEAAVPNGDHREAILSEAEQLGITGKGYTYGSGFFADTDQALDAARVRLESDPDTQSFDDWQAKEYKFAITRASGTGPLSDRPLPFLLLWCALAAGSILYYVLMQLRRAPGDNNQIYRSPLTRGFASKREVLLVSGFLIGFLVFGYFYLQGNWIWPAGTACVALIIVIIVRRPKATVSRESFFSRSPAWAGLLLASLLILFYILLYWAPWYVIPWIRVTDPLSRWLNGGPASQWFLYGFMYTVVILVFGVRMLVRYRNSHYQMLRTCSVMFFQLCFAFLIPEILVRLNQPYFDFKNIWPLNYSFFFDWNLNNLIDSGKLGMFMLFWGIVLIILAVPVFTYLYGKRWYCSWVCGCGGLANTVGDSFRHLSNKSLLAWKYERWIVHGVLVFAVIMTALVLYTFWSGERTLGFINTDSVRGWYGFLIGSAFAGVVGTGFYPLMGTRVWCRFGCPLAAYIGLIQRFKSRFRITVNGGQCISCGNCSTYCEMGIDVRHYAQRGQDIVRASCVGCGMCAQVCPRGVLRLENVSGDVDQRAEKLRTVYVKEDDVRLLG